MRYNFFAIALSTMSISMGITRMDPLMKVIHPPPYISEYWVASLTSLV